MYWGSSVSKKKGIWAGYFFGNGVRPRVVNMPSFGMCLSALLGIVLKD